MLAPTNREFYKTLSCSVKSLVTAVLQCSVTEVGPQQTPKFNLSCYVSLLQDLCHFYFLMQFSFVSTFTFPYHRNRFIIRAANFLIIFVKIADILEIHSMEIRYHTFFEVPMMYVSSIYRIYRQTLKLPIPSSYYLTVVVQVAHSNLHV
jgi:hypothetical protein